MKSGKRSAKTRVLKLLPTMRNFVDDRNRFCFCVAAVQTGKSLSSALKHVMKRIETPGLSVLMSASERQSKELMEKVAVHLGGLGARFQDDAFEDTSITQHTVTLPNRSRIICLPANPRTARGYTGDVLLDEFGVMENSQEIWAALMTRITRGFSIDVMGTYYGTQNKFFELGEMLGLATGLMPKTQPVVNGPWHGYMLTMPAAIGEGLDIDFGALRQAIGDEQIVAQDYLCVPMRGGDAYIPLELVVSCEHPSATEKLNPQMTQMTQMVGGWDIARTTDHSAFVVGEVLDQLPRIRVCGLFDWSGMSFPQQLGEARRLLPHLERLVMDATGMGGPVAEELAMEFPGKVEGAVMTIAVKERLAVEGKRAMEEQRLLLPVDNRRIRAAFQSLKRYQASSGHMRIDAAQSRDGHGDEAWAIWLMLSAASAGNYVPASLGGVFGQTIWSAGVSPALTL